MPGIVSGFYGISGQNRSEASYDTSIAGLNVMSGVNVTLRVDASNVLNHPAANTPMLTLAPSATTNTLNTTFGQILNATGFSTLGAKTGSRQVQAVLRVTF